MIVQFINKSNKKRSKSTKQCLSDFTQLIAMELGIVHKIDKVIFTYKKDWGYNYYPKKKPLAGFKYLYSNRIVRIDFTKHWDYDIQANLMAIVHELTHVRQLISKDLKIYKDKEAYWIGNKNETWKLFRDSIFDELSEKEQLRYLRLVIPWEVEVQNNLKQYVGTICKL